MRIGIDLGGTKIEAIALDEAGAVLSRRRIASPQGDYGATLQAIRDLVPPKSMPVRCCTRPLAPGLAKPARANTSMI